MCGIVGYSGKRSAQEVLLNGLEKLEYRGYDSAGVALALEGGIHYVSRMRCQGQRFDGYYYFDEQTGSLSSGGVTVQGLTVETDGKIKELVKPGTDSLEKKLEELLNGFEGQWSVYVKDLGSGEQFSINNQSMTSASVIKAFVMAASYENMAENNHNIYSLRHFSGSAG